MSLFGNSACTCTPSLPYGVYIMVCIVVLVSTKFVLRLVPRGVPKRIAIRQKSGIPCYMLCKYGRKSTMLCTTLYTMLCAQLYTQLVPCNARVYTFIGPLLVTKKFPRPTAAAGSLCSLFGFFKPCISTDIF